MAGRAEAVRSGQSLGPYELVREIGSGGFASVWLARRPGPGGFEARVAIKLIRIELRTDPAFQKMFLDEAKLAARINHPNVVGIFELGESESGLYLVMEYVAGRPLNVLNNIVRREGKKIPVGIVMRIIADTCAGLHAAHELSHNGKSLGVIHRDVSPQNILVSDRGVVKLIDFGVAKANDRLAADTTDGHTKGKLRYMAPEQALAKAVDRRADLWSAAAVAFDLIEGHPPYDGHNDLARLFKLMDKSPPPSFATDVPARIVTVLQTALEREPDARFGTAGQMRAAIEAALDACDLRVNADTIVEFFGDALTPPTDDGYDAKAPSERGLLRARLERRSVRAGTTTLDVVAPDAETSESPAAAPPEEEHAGEQAAAAPHEPSAEGEPIETLSALNTSPHGVPRQKPHRLMAIAGVASLLLVTAVVLGLRREAPLAAKVQMSTTTTSATAPVVEPSAIPESAPSGSASAIASAAPESEAPSVTSKAPTTKPVVRTKGPRPRGGKPPSAVGSSSSRPRYDDTIQ